MSGIVWQRVLEERMPGPPDAGPVLAFAEPIAEAACVATASVMTPLASRAVLRVAGADAQAFLHSQLTADIAAMQVGAAGIAAWCTAKGRVIATVQVLRRGEDFLLVLSADLADVVLTRLRMYVLRAKVLIDNLHDEVGVLGCSGAAALEALEDAPADSDQAPGILPAFAPAGGVRRALLVAGPEVLAEQWDRLSACGVLAVGEAAWNRVLVRAAEPHIVAATREAFIPQMLNLDRLGGISFEKGCYAGQEIVARTHHLGQLKRRMFIGSSAGHTPPAPGQTLHIPGAEQAVGEVVSSAYTETAGECEWLAVVRIEATQQPLQLSGNGAAVQLRPPPYALNGD